MHRQLLAAPLPGFGAAAALQQLPHLAVGADAGLRQNEAV